MSGSLRIKRLAAILCLALVLSVGGALAVPASASASSPDSTFNFSGSGGFFYGKLHFIDEWNAYMSFAQLDDTLCDSRSEYADIFDQRKQLHTYVNSSDCGTSVIFNGVTFYDGYQIKYIQVRLRACNTWGCSSSRWSLKHDNPYN